MALLCPPSADALLGALEAALVRVRDCDPQGQHVQVSFYKCNASTGKFVHDWGMLASSDTMECFSEEENAPCLAVQSPRGLKLCLHGWSWYEVFNGVWEWEGGQNKSGPACEAIYLWLIDTILH